MKTLYSIILIISFNVQLFSNEDDITKWFDREKQIFLNFNNENAIYTDDIYLKSFIERNFAIKSIAYGLIPQTILDNTDDETLNEYLLSFEKYLTKTIYLLSLDAINGEINLIDIDIKDNIFQLTTEIKYNDSSSRAYWKVAYIKSSYKIIDIIIENTSYFVTKKSEFSKILRRNKGDLKKLINELNVS